MERNIDEIYRDMLELPRIPDRWNIQGNRLVKVRPLIFNLNWSLVLISSEYIYGIVITLLVRMWLKG